MEEAAAVEEHLAAGNQEERCCRLRMRPCLSIFGASCVLRSSGRGDGGCGKKPGVGEEDGECWAACGGEKLWCDDWPAEDARSRTKDHAVACRQRGCRSVICTLICGNNG